MPSVELIALISLLIGLPVAVVLLALAVLVYPQARLFLGDLLRVFGFMGRWVRRASLASEMEGSINIFTKEFNSEVSDALLPECRVTWVTGENYATTITPGSVIVRVSFGADHDTNLYNAASVFVSHSLLPRAKAHLARSTAAALDLVMVRNIVRHVKRSALRLFNEHFNGQAEPIQVVYYKLEAVDRAGLLNRILIQEYHYFGELMGDRAPRPESQGEANDLLVWLHRLATREEDERTPLHFSTASFRVGVILVAKEQTYNTHGVEPYLRRAATYAADGFHTIYLLSRGRKRGSVAKTIATRLCETGGFEANLRGSDVEIGDDDSRELVTCIPLRVDRVALVQTAWERVEQARSKELVISALVLGTEPDGIHVDVYGLRVRIENPHLAGMNIPDAGRYFKRSEELQVRVLEVDPAANHLIVSNVGTGTDPKIIVDAFAGKMTDTLPATVTGIVSVDGLETGLRLALDDTATQGYITRSRACMSRFISIGEKFPVGAKVDVKVLGFRSEYNTWTCEIANLQNPWDLIPDYKPGDVNEVVIREIAERYVVCEIAEGAEGIVYTNEIAWGDEAERRRVIDALTPGQKSDARILHFDRTNRDLRLSLKRVSQSAVATFYSEVKGRTVPADIIEFRARGAMVRFEGSNHQGFLSRSELTWSFCDSVEGILKLNESILVQAIQYREDLDSILVSAKAARRNEYQGCCARLSEEAAVNGKIWAIGKDSAYVDIEIDGATAAGYLHMSEVSNSFFVTPELLSQLLQKERRYTFAIKRFDDKHQVVELSRRRWLRSNHRQLEYGRPYSCTAIPLDRRRMVLYGNEFECVVPLAATQIGNDVEIFIARKGATEKDLEIHYESSTPAGRR